MSVMSKAPGRNIADAERNTTKVTLRLAPEAAEDLESLAEQWGITKAEVVARLVTRAREDERIREKFAAMRTTSHGPGRGPHGSCTVYARHTGTCSLGTYGCGGYHGR